jgi:Putative esterase
MRVVAAVFAFFLGALCLADPSAPLKTELRFEITVGKGLLPAPQDGRMLVVLGRSQKDPEPRQSINETGNYWPPVLGVDARGLTTGSKVVVDQSALIFPLGHLARLPAGMYFVQAVFDYNPDIRLHDAPGNLVSEPVGVMLDPQKGGTLKIELTRQLPAEELPQETEYVKYVKLRSELLSKFHGRPMYLRAGIILPRDHDKETERRYPLRVTISGFGSRYTDVAGKMSLFSDFRRHWLSDKCPRMILLHLDGAGPLGDPYQVNSSNNGPYGDAVIQELIPFVEKKYRGIGRPYARVLDGVSTGGWVSLALQIFYADFFQGAWSHCPDPVDFRAYELINLYQDSNAYVNRHGFERPASRELNGDVRTTVRHECLLERVLGRGNRWELSGRDWCCWNAVFGPRGADGLPKPLWDGVTGKMDPSVLEHWKKYDLHLVLEKYWPILRPKLKGKLHVWVGDADDYYLNNAVYLLDDFLSKAKPAAEHRFTYGPRKGHFWRGLTEAAMMDEMALAIAGGERQK